MICKYLKFILAHQVRHQGETHSGNKHIDVGKEVMTINLRFLFQFNILKTISEVHPLNS